MNSSKQIIAIASRYGMVIRHTFPDLYSAIVFLKKGAREGKHLALGAFSPATGVMYTLDEHDLDSYPQVQNKGLTKFVDLGIEASRIEVY